MGRCQCRQLRHEKRERQSIQPLDPDLAALVDQQPMVCGRHLGFWKPQLAYKVEEGRSGQCVGAARGSEGIDLMIHVRRVAVGRHICGNLQDQR